MCDTVCIVQAGMFSFALVSLPLYLTFLTTLIRFRNDELEGPFYSLVLSIGAIDIIGGTGLYSLSHFRVWGWFERVYLLADQPLARVAEFISWTTPIGQSIGVTLVAFNRASAIIYPIKYQSLWAKVLPMCLVGKWVSATVLGSAAGLTLSVSYVRQNDSTYYPVFVDAEISRSLLILFSVILTACVLTSLAYLVSFFAIYRRHRTSSVKPDADDKQVQAKIEVNLALTGVVLFLVMSLWCVYASMAVFFADYTGYTAFYVFWAVVSDLFTWINPYLFLICSSKIRKCFYKTITCCANKDSETTPVIEVAGSNRTAGVNNAGTGHHH